MITTNAWQAGLMLVGYLLAVGVLITPIALLIVSFMPDVEDPYDAAHDE